MSGIRPFWALTAYRYGCWAATLPRPLRQIASFFYLSVQPIAAFVGGVYLHRDTKLGAEPHIIHGGNIKINPYTQIGDRVGIMHGVTLGTAEGIEQNCPVIGNDVFLGASCTVLGAVSIGDGATIAANSLVIRDVPPGMMAIGVPARVVPKAKKVETAKQQT